MNAEKSLIRLVKTGKLSFRQMLETIKLNNSQWQIIQAVVEEVNWSKLSPRQMFEAIELSGNSSQVADAVIRTGKLSPRQMVRIATKIKRLYGDDECSYVFCSAIEIGLSPRQMIKIIKQSKGYSGVDSSIVCAVVKTGKLSLRHVCKIINKLCDDYYCVRTLIMEGIDWNKLSFKQLLKAIKLLDNNSKFDEYCLATSLLGTSLDGLNLLPEIARRIDWSKLSSKQMLKITEQLSGSQGQFVLAVVKTGKLSFSQLLKIISRFGGDYLIVKAVVERIDWSNLLPGQVSGIIGLSDNGCSVLAKEIVKTNELFFKQLLEVIKQCGNFRSVTKAVVKRIDWSSLSPELLLETVRLSGNYHIAAVAIKTRKLPSKQAYEVYKMSGCYPHIIQLIAQQLEPI